MALLQHQYNQAEYYQGTYSFTGDGTTDKFTITKTRSAVRSSAVNPQLVLGFGYAKVYVDNVLLPESYLSTGNVTVDNFKIKWDNTTSPTTDGWYIEFEPDSIPSTNFTIVFNDGDPDKQWGGYQFMPLDEVINNFMIVYVGEDKIVSKDSRTDVAFHAQRALAELSFDTFKSCKSQEIEIPANLTMILPHDYVNYVKLSWKDSSGIERIIYPTRNTSNPKSIKQEADGTYSHDYNSDGVSDSDNLIYNENSDTWNSYKSTTPSENNTDDYEDDEFWPNLGGRHGLDPENAQINGSYYIDCTRGKIHFSSNLSGKTVILKYISDSLGTDEEMQVHKFAEEALYKWIMYGVLSTRTNIPEYVVQRYKKEKFAETRKAKLRLSNIKLEEITQVLRGKSKQIKH